MHNKEFLDRYAFLANRKCTTSSTHYEETTVISMPFRCIHQKGILLFYDIKKTNYRIKLNHNMNIQ